MAVQIKERASFLYNIICITLFLTVFLLPVQASFAKAVTLISHGQTYYSIYYSPHAPSSVRVAALELQRVLEISTGVTMPIRNIPTEKMICLGSGKPTQDAGLSADDLKEEGFRIVTKGKNLFIFGKDTPDGERTKVGGFSRGTQFGVLSFLESQVGVRWLLPEAVGEDIPSHVTVTIQNLNVRQEPAFQFRQLMTGQRPPAVVEWLTRQKVSGFSTLSNTTNSMVVFSTHSWAWYISQETLSQYPELRRNTKEKNKFCTRNPLALQLFVEGLTRWIESHPQFWMASISPSDGQGFCRCKECQNGMERDWHGQRSVTANILNFYNQVARILREKYPNKALSGYVYGSYMYPPSSPIKLEPNLYLQLAPLNYYGFCLYKLAYRNELERLIAGWRAITKHITYESLSVWLNSVSGAPYGPGLAILKAEIPLLQKYGYLGACMHGCWAWGYGGPLNYLLAKLLWDPSTDVEAVYQEWLQRAYGDGWRSMDKIYRLLDAEWKGYKMDEEPIGYRGTNYEINRQVIRKIYLPILAKIETLYLEALRSARTSHQKKRLEMFGDNLIVFNYNLRKAGLLKDPEKSSFFRNDSEYKQFMASRTGRLALAADRRGKTLARPISE